MRAWFADVNPSPRFKTLNVILALRNKVVARFSLITVATTTALFARIIPTNKSVVFVALPRFALPRNVELDPVVDAVPICVIAASTRKGACAKGKVDDN